uniref:Uncharacterized protein n=1 Tax=Pipistrellus kuhlii TaxID=59472 RepID=A0A7J8B265_PIPKU|nr:hypothetical protein mPipKuh1_007798 [Pipistrellus kuhlii]
MEISQVQMSSQERNGDQPDCGLGEGQATCLWSQVLVAVPTPRARERNKLPTPQSPVPVASAGLSEATLGPGCLRSARGKEDRVLGACDQPEEGILGSGCAARQRQLRPAREQASRGPVRDDQAGSHMSD